VDILALNPGSATLKFDLYRVTTAAGGTAATGLARRAGGIVDRLGSERAELRLDVEGEQHPREPVGGMTAARAAGLVLERLRPLVGPPGLGAIGCRVVHGGSRFARATRVTPEIVEAVRGLGALAPLHNPLDADVLDACMDRGRTTPVVAIFDTAFHQTLPEVAWRYAIPRDLADRLGLRRYGFHGIAHRQVSEHLLARLPWSATPSRCVTCHLGNGASLCAVLGGRSVDTTMGVTPMEGLVMGTRSGDVDPGLVLHLIRAGGKTPDEVDEILNRRSGLLGLSGRTADVRDLEQAAGQGDGGAELALEVFAYRAGKAIGACAVALGGLDAIAFSGGIGEHSTSMRERICRRLGFLGVHLDAARNASAGGREPARITRDDSAVQAWVIPADENVQIARETFDLVSRG
jgi:acetate kinase